MGGRDPESRFFFWNTRFFSCCACHFFFLIRARLRFFCDFSKVLVQGNTTAFSAFYLRPSTHKNSRGHTPPHGQTPSGPHTAAHSPALTSIACSVAPNGRYSIAGSNIRCVVDMSLMLEHLDQARQGAPPPPPPAATAGCMTSDLRLPPAPH